MSKLRLAIILMLSEVRQVLRVLFDELCRPLDLGCAVPFGIPLPLADQKLEQLLIPNVAKVGFLQDWNARGQDKTFRESEVAGGFLRLRGR